LTVLQALSTLRMPTMVNHAGGCVAAVTETQHALTIRVTSA